MAPAGASNSKGSSGGGGGGAGAGAGAPPAVGGGDDQQCAYAKLWGRTGVLQTEFTAFVKSLPCRLGRIPPSAVGDDGFVDQIPDDFVHLGNDKSISRHHATIDWLADAGGYMITCHSKNGIVVDKMWKSKDGQTQLHANSAVKIGTCCFYFLLPMEGDDNGAGEGGPKGRQSSR